MAYFIFIEAVGISSCFYCKTAGDVLILTNGLRDKKAKLSITDESGAVLSVSEFFRKFTSEKTRVALRARAIDGIRKRLAQSGLKAHSGPKALGLPLSGRDMSASASV
jgi:hypothetical protein